MYFYLVKFVPGDGYYYNTHDGPFRRFLLSVNKNVILERVFTTKDYTVHFEDFKITAYGTIIGPLDNTSQTTFEDETSDDGAGGELYQCKRVADFHMLQHNVYDWHTTDTHYKVDESKIKTARVEEREVKVKRFKVI